MQQKKRSLLERHSSRSACPFKIKMSSSSNNVAATANPNTSREPSTASTNTNGSSGTKTMTPQELALMRTRAKGYHYGSPSRKKMCYPVQTSSSSPSIIIVRSGHQQMPAMSQKVLVPAPVKNSQYLHPHQMHQSFLIKPGSSFGGELNSVASTSIQNQQKHQKTSLTPKPWSSLREAANTKSLFSLPKRRCQSMIENKQTEATIAASSSSESRALSQNVRKLHSPGAQHSSVENMATVTTKNELTVPTAAADQEKEASSAPRKNSTDALRSVRSASINVIKKGIKMGTTGFSAGIASSASKSSTNNSSTSSSSSKKQALSPDMFDFSTGEPSALGFEPLTAQTSKPEISVVNLSEYTQVLKKPESSSKVDSQNASEAPLSNNSAAQPSIAKPRVVTFDVPIQVKASQNSLSLSTPDLRSIGAATTNQEELPQKIGHDSTTIPASKEARAASSQSSCCTCSLEGPHHLTRMLKRAHFLLSKEDHHHQYVANQELTTTALIKCRKALTKHLITTLVALNEVNQELEKVILEPSTGHDPKRAMKMYKSADFLFDGLARKPVKALSFPYLCEPDHEEISFHEAINCSQPRKEDGRYSWLNFSHAKETQIVL